MSAQAVTRQNYGPAWEASAISQAQWHAFRSMTLEQAGDTKEAAAHLGDAGRISGDA